MTILCHKYQSNERYSLPRKYFRNHHKTISIVFTIHSTIKRAKHHLLSTTTGRISIFSHLFLSWPVWRMNNIVRYDSNSTDGAREMDFFRWQKERRTTWCSFGNITWKICDAGYIFWNDISFDSVYHKLPPRTSSGDVVQTFGRYWAGAGLRCPALAQQCEDTISLWDS